MRFFTQKATAAMVAAAMPAPSASVTITDKKAHTVAPTTPDPANRKANIVARTFKGNFPRGHALHQHRHLHGRKPCTERDKIDSFSMNGLDS